MTINKKPYTLLPLSPSCLPGRREALPDDGLLYGTKSIAAHLKLTPRQAAHLIDKGHLPTFRLGAIICSTQRGLAEHFSQLIRSTEGE